jgi:hypothetical protein
MRSNVMKKTESKLMFELKNYCLSEESRENFPKMKYKCRKQTTNPIKCVKDNTDQFGKEARKQLVNVMLYSAGRDPQICFNEHLFSNFH